MAMYREFSDLSSGLRIEVEDAGAETGTSPYVAEFLGALQNLAVRVQQQFNQGPPEQRPTELGISFGLKALSTGGFAVGLGDGSANFRVSMKWSEDSKHDPLGGVDIPGLQSGQF